MRSSALSISGRFYIAIRSILCVLLVALEEKYMCLGTRVKKSAGQRCKQTKIPSDAGDYKIHEMHKNLHPLWLSNRAGR